MDWRGADGSAEDVPANEPCPWTWCACVSLHGPTTSTTSTSRWVLRQQSYGCCTQRMVEPLGWKSSEKSPGLHVSWWWGSHLQPPSLGLPHLWVKAPSAEWCCRNWDLSRGQRVKRASLVAQDGRESACNAGDSGSMPESGRSLSERNGYPLQYSCLGNSMDRGAWQATIHGVAKSWTWLSKLTIRSKKGRRYEIQALNVSSGTFHS